MDDEEEEKGKDDFRDEAGNQRVAARRVVEHNRYRRNRH